MRNEIRLPCHTTTSPGGAGSNGATMDRRGFLGLVGIAGAALLTGCTPGAGSAGRGNTGGLAWSTRLHVPSVDAGTVAADGTRRFRLRAQAGRSQFISGKSTTSWGFNGPYLGPTLRAQSGERVAMEVHNELAESTTVHWHGMRLPAAMDGTPHQPVEAGSVWRPTWTIDQPASTLWYHPHPHGDTAVHVYRGLAGMWIIDDGIPDGLPGTYGSDDIPLIIQDRNIGADGSLREDDTVPIWGLMGNDILVNGTHGPYLEVHTRLVRFRVLNASNARMYNLRLSDGRPITIVGNDCALLPAPVQVDEISLSPAERAEIVVAFNPGETVVLTSRSGDNGLDEGEFDILQLRAATTLRTNGPVPSSLPGPAPIAPPADARTRRFVLSGNSKINGREMEMGRIDEVVPVGATEIWEIDNTVYSHNFHVHDAAFSILDIDGHDPPAYASGWKDTVFVGGHKTAKVAVTFGHHADPTTPYMYHCHILQHEDKGMMGQFTLVESTTQTSPPSGMPRTAGRHEHAASDS